MPTCLPTPPFCASVSLLAPTLMAQQGVWKGLVYFLGGSSYPKCGGLNLNPLPTLYGQGHKAGGGSRASRGRRSCQALNQCLPGSVSPGYSSTTFSMLRCRLQPPSPANPLPGWRGGSLWDLPSHQLNKSSALFACRAPTLPRQLCWDASTQELSAGGSSVTPVPSIAALLQGRSGTLLYISVTAG